MLFGHPTLRYELPSSPTLASEPPGKVGGGALIIETVVSESVWQILAV